jgi:hypothetical protein
MPRAAEAIFIRLERHLDLNDVSTPIREVPRRGWPGAGPRQIDYLEAGQRACALLDH